MVEAAAAPHAPRLSLPDLVYVDLDLTLLRTDLLYECAFRHIAMKPASSAQLLGWLSRGRAHLKRMAADSAELSLENLPFRERVVEYLERRKAQGATIVLATAADGALASRVARRFACIDRVLATGGKGTVKLNAIERDAERRPFEYVGDARCDLPIWKAAAVATVVRHSDRLLRAARRANPRCEVIDDATVGVRDVLQAIRIHQWVKNLLVFVPLLPIWPVVTPEKLALALMAFVAFCLCASSVYVINDLLDLDADRRHERKRQRPFACGRIPITWAPPMIAVLLGASLLIAAAAGPRFLLLLATYFSLTLLYSLELKRRALVDVVTLATLYTLRILAGAAAVAVMPSFWLLAFGMFAFYSLALAKRYVEVADLIDGDKVRSLHRRGYRGLDGPYLLAMGAASSMAAVVVFALYLNDPRVQARFAHVQILWLLCPILLYWLSRLWLKAVRKELHDDPVVFALKDRPSRIFVALAALALIAAPLP